MAKNRTKSSIRNAMFSIVGQFLSIVLQFINRTVFVQLLSTEYLGLNGLFSNILSILSLSELGVGIAMSYALYKPVSNGDTEKIKSLMHLYKKTYTAIGCFVILASVVISPFLPYLVEDMPDLKLITVYYLLYALNSGVSYFYTYKRTLIICDQDSYISTITQTVASLLTKIIQVVILIVTHNYLFYLLVQIFFTVSENVLISRIADKRYAYLKEKNVSELLLEEKNDIKQNIKAMLCHKIGFVTVTATDNLILSKVLGLVSVGLFSNYSMIVDNINALTDKFIYSISASVGNLVAVDTKKQAERVFYNLLFVNYWVISFCATCLFCLLQSFITLWLGKDYLLSDSAVLIMVLCFYVSRMRSIVNIFKEAAGVLRQDRYKALFESVVNLAISIPLTYKMGVAGVKLGTLISTLLVPFWFEGYVLFKHYFGNGFAKYMLMQFGYFVSFTGITAVTFMLCYCMPGEGIINFGLKLIICCVVPNIAVMLLYFRTEGFRYLFEKIMQVLHLRVKE